MAPVSPAPTLTPEKPPEKIKTKPVGSLAAPATIVVSLPVDAKLLVDDVATTSTSALRVFVSPTLDAGKEYHYTMKVSFLQDGKTVEMTKKVAVTAGNETAVSFDAAAPSVASR